MTKKNSAQYGYITRNPARNESCRVYLGWKVGLEPTTFRTTICRSNQLNYVHHILVKRVQRYEKKMVLPNFFVPFFLFFILQGLLEQLELPSGHLHQLQE